MHHAGISYGVHTKTRPISYQLSRDQIEEEIIRARLAIENRFGIPIKVFAHSNGKREDYNEFYIQLLKYVGFRFR